jgi:hypothetical protein
VTLTLEGRDLSHHDGKTPNLTGLSFVFCKASEGLSWTYAETHDAHQAQAKAKGLLRASYHFLHPGDGAQQARSFLAASKAAKESVHGFAVDVEMLADNKTHPSYADLEAFHTEFHRLMPGRTLFVYSYLWFWENTFGNPTHDCPHCVLWTSALHPEWPTAAYGGFRRVTLHQYATSPVDRDRFQGSWGDLAELFSTPAPAPAPKPVPKGNTPLLHSGMVGQKVADIQHALDLLHNHTAHTDGMGHFGRETLRVLELFQKNRSLKVTGTTTPETWKALRLVAHPKEK